MRKLLWPVLFSLIAIDAQAVEPLTSAVLLEQCAVYQLNSSTNEAVSCRAWVHGFLGGAFATRTSRSTDAGKPESFEERAARTRLGRSRLDYGRNREAGYCLPVGATLDEIIYGLSSYAAGLQKVPEQANQLMLQLLQARYACPKN